MLKVIAVFKTDLFAKIANITATLQIAFLLTWQGTPVAGFTGYNNYWKHCRNGWNGWTDGWMDENTPVIERERTFEVVYLINLTAEFVNTYINTHINRMQCGVL